MQDFLGALLALGAVGYINAASGLPVVLGSFGANCVLLFGFPESVFVALERDRRSLFHVPHGTRVSGGVWFDIVLDGTRSGDCDYGHASDADGPSARQIEPGDRDAFGTLWSAKIRSRSGRSEGVFIVQPTEHRFGTHGIGLSATMPRSRLRDHFRSDRWIGNTGTQCHVRASAIVMTDPGFQDETQMGFGQWDQPIQTFPADRANHTLTNSVRLWTVRR